MVTVMIIAVSIGGAILLLLTIGFLLIGIIKAFKTGGISKKDRMANAEETKMIQDIYRGLSKMEERVETLETILMDHRRKDVDDEKIL
ncbi:MAG: phage-shock protein [Desulfobacteraceae bacterium]|nr:MAG: phage-shock protein [Desulfobacteraceae bacterium]